MEKRMTAWGVSLLFILTASICLYTGVSIGAPVQEPEEELRSLESAGEYSIAAYCGCEQCCGTDKKILTYYGAEPIPNHTIAADFSLFSPGDQLSIDGITYIVEDRVPSKSADALRIYFDSHDDAINFGRRTLEVYRIPDDTPAPEGEFLGEFIVTGYCSCEICTGIYSKNGLTFNEVKPLPSRTIAADPDIVPLNSTILIGDTVYTVEDTGKNIKGHRLDIYFESHEEAVIYGRKTEKVYLVEAAKESDENMSPDT